MKPLWHTLFRASLLAPTLAVGCRQVEHTSGCATCHGRPPTASVVSAPAATMDTGGYNVVRAHPVMSIPAAEPVVSSPPAMLPEVSAPMPVVTAPTTTEDEPVPSRMPDRMPEPQRMPTGGAPAVVRNIGPMDRPQMSVSMKVVDLPTTVIGATDTRSTPVPALSPGVSVSTPPSVGLRPPRSITACWWAI